ncbi:MAG: hypothetical protein WDZ79_00965 [Candidatus Paceibacterota bacterium]
MRTLKRTVEQYYTNRYAVWVLGFIFICALSFYLFAINKTVHNVVERQDLQTELAALGAEINRLEFQYIRSKNEIGLETAYELGFVEHDHVTYVTRPALGQAVTQSGSI